MRAKWVGAASLLVACAGAPPQELVDARAAFERAGRGPAVEFNAVGLHVAQTALDIAQRTYETDGLCDKTRDRGYVAIRKVERAEVLARTRQFEAAAEASERRTRIKQIARDAFNRRELARTKSDLVEVTAPQSAPQ